MKVLILDNYDSFTHNLFHLIEQLVDSCDVVRNDQLDLNQVAEFDKIVLSPGPGLPKDAGCMMELLQRFAHQKSIFGVCLGMQAIAEHYGAELYNLMEVRHGVASAVNILDESDILFKGIPNRFEVGRYHSWAVQEVLPDGLKVTAVDGEGVTMALRHEHNDVCGVQFHPESIMTSQGMQLMTNWINC